jgi:hypothetical protein
MQFAVIKRPLALCENILLHNHLLSVCAGLQIVYLYAAYNHAVLQYPVSSAIERVDLAQIGVRSVNGSQIFKHFKNNFACYVHI